MTKKKKAANEPAWKNRIVGYFEKPAKEFNFNPLNWREHGNLQRASLNAVLSKIGWVTGVVENKTTGNLIDGHARIEEALKQGDETIVPYILVDLSEDEERQILALLDPIGNLATTDAEKLSELSELIQFDSEILLNVVKNLLPAELLEVPADETPNLTDPGFNYESQFGVIVNCENELHQKQIFDRLASEGLKVKVVVV